MLQEVSLVGMHENDQAYEYDTICSFNLTTCVILFS